MSVASHSPQAAHRAQDEHPSKNIAEHLTRAHLRAGGVNALGNVYLESSGRRLAELAIAIALVIALLPVLALILLAIRVSSPGPILFRQLRHGRGMRPFA